MLVLRIVGGLLIVVLGVSVFAYALTRDRRWLRFARQTLSLGLIILLIFFGLYALERLAIII